MSLRRRHAGTGEPSARLEHGQAEQPLWHGSLPGQSLCDGGEAAFGLAFTATACAFNAGQSGNAGCAGRALQRRRQLMAHRCGDVSVQSYVAASPLRPIVGFLTPAFAVHTGFDGGVSGGLIAIGLHCFNRRFLVIAVSRWTVFLVLLARNVFIFVAELHVPYHVRGKRS